MVVDAKVVLYTDKEQAMQTNYLGLQCHPTDEYVHWKDDDGLATMKTLRAAYDKLIELGCADELKILLDAAYHQGKMDESDYNNPDL